MVISKNWLKIKTAYCNHQNIEIEAICFYNATALIHFSTELWSIPESEETNEWLSAVVSMRESSFSSVRFQFAAKNLQTSFLSLDLDDIAVNTTCGKI